MKNKFWLGLVSGALLAALLLTLFGDFLPKFTNSNSHMKDYEVYMKLVGPTGKHFKLKAKKGNTDCPDDPEMDGCLTVNEGDEATVEFILQNKVKNKIFHVSEMKICKGTTKADQNCNLTNEEQDEFAVEELNRSKRYHPDANGVIDFRKIPGEIYGFNFINSNTIPGDYFYSIKVCLPGEVDSECRDTDPGIKNGGRTLHN